jgi:hypothetical protein
MAPGEARDSHPLGRRTSRARRGAAIDPGERPGRGAAAVLAACLNRPTSMARDARTGAVYITELITGRLLVVQ